MLKLSIIIPAYNEENRIINTLQDYYNFFSKKFRDQFEIIVVPNNCNDNTFDVVKNFSKNKEHIKIKNIPYFVGKGGAIRDGIYIANGELIGFVDADNSTNPDAFYELYNNINGYDGIIASRWIKGAVINKKQPLSRRIASRSFNILVRTIFGLNVRDTQCGSKLFKRKPLLEIIPKLSTTRWAFDVDLLYKLKLNNYKVVEIPTIWNDNPDSKLNIKKASFEMFLAISRLRLIHSPFKFIVALYEKIIR